MDLIERGRRARRENRPQEAHHNFTKALALASDISERARALTGLGQIERDIGNLARASELYSEAVILCRGLPDGRRLAHTIRHVGDIERERRNLGAAEPAYREALAIYRADPETGKLDLANTLNGLALLLTERGEKEEARSLTQEARDLYSSTNVPAGVRECSQRLITLLAALVLLVATERVAGAQPNRPAIEGVAHIAFYVSDLERTRRFWKDFLGFEECFSLKRGTTEEVRIAFIKINDNQYVELFNEKPRAGQMLNHLSFYTDNAEAMRNYLAFSGTKVPSSVPKGQTGNKNFTFADPDGNQIEIVQYQPDSWTARERGKFMPDTRISDHIAHVGALVGFLQPAMDFYSGVLGFKEFWRGSSGVTLSWINMRVPDGQDYLEFMLYDSLPEPDQRGGRNHLSLTVPDAQRAVEVLKSRPAFRAYGKEIKVQVGRNRKRQVNIFDPDGSRVELMEPVTIDGKLAPSSDAPLPRVIPRGTGAK